MASLFDIIIDFLNSSVTNFLEKYKIDPNVIQPAIYNVSSISSKSREFRTSPRVNDNKLREFIYSSFQKMKEVLEMMETNESLSVKGFADVWRFDNIKFSILTTEVQIHNAPLVVMEDMVCQMEKGIVKFTLKWPQVKLTQNYKLMSGIVDGKKATGSGILKLALHNFTFTPEIKFKETSSRIVLDPESNVTVRFDDVKVNMEGLIIEDEQNSEEYLNNVLIRDKDNLNETLQTNMNKVFGSFRKFLNSTLRSTEKRDVYQMLFSWHQS